MLKIEVTDPHLCSHTQLKALSAFFLALEADSRITTSGDRRTAPVPELDFPKINVAGNPAVGAELSFPKINVADNPAVGAELSFPKINAEVKFPRTPSAAEAFATAPKFPSGAPFTAGVVPLPTAPVAPPAISITTPVAPLPPVAPLAFMGAVPVAPPTVNPAPGVEVDRHGLPWDGRIHSGGRAKIQDGSWKAKRGVDPAVIAAVEDELRTVMSIPPAVPAAPSWPFQKTAADLQSEDGGVHNTAHTMTDPGSIIPAPAAPVVPVMGFAQILPKVTGALSAGTLTQSQVLAALQAVGLPSLPMLAARQDLIPAIHAALFPS